MPLKIKHKMKPFAGWIEANPPPDLQALVAEHGGWDGIPEDAWKAFRIDLKVWLDRERNRHG